MTTEQPTTPRLLPPPKPARWLRLTHDDADGFTLVDVLTGKTVVKPDAIYARYCYCQMAKLFGGAPALFATSNETRLFLTANIGECAMDRMGLFDDLGERVV